MLLVIITASIVISFFTHWDANARDAVRGFIDGYNSTSTK
jgi:hypothetical protein